MDLQLLGKRALVTGSSTGIGEGIAKTLAREGAIAVVHGRNEEQANRVVSEIREDGGKAFVAIGDLSTDEGATQVVDKALSSVGGIDIIVNNAGSYFNSNWSDTTPDAWGEIYNNNVLSTVRTIRLLVGQMKELGWGRIIQISSGLATQPLSIMPDYGATKAAMLNLTVSLAKELAGTGITVNTVSPGIIVTSAYERQAHEIAAKFGWGTDWAEIEKHILQEFYPTPVGRLGRIEDIANFVTYLSSPLSGYINGANLRVDGGATVTIN